MMAHGGTFDRAMEKWVFMLVSHRLPNEMENSLNRVRWWLNVCCHHRPRHNFIATKAARTVGAADVVVVVIKLNVCLIALRSAFPSVGGVRRGNRRVIRERENRLWLFVLNKLNAYRGLRYVELIN